MSPTEKLLTGLREAADNILLYGQMMKTHDLAVTKDFVISDVSVVDDLRKALVAFTAEMPGAIGVALKHVMDLPLRQRMPLDLQAALAELEGSHGPD